jgi:hypothetical protein
MPSNAVAALLLSGRNRQRRFSGTTLMMHGAPALVLAQHLGRNLRFKGSPLCDRPRSNICLHQCRSRQAPSEQCATLAASIVIAAGSGVSVAPAVVVAMGIPPTLHCTVPAQATTPSSSAPFTVLAQAATRLSFVVAVATDIFVSFALDFGHHSADCSGRAVIEWRPHICCGPARLVI